MKLGGIMSKAIQTTTREWLDYQDASIYSGLGRTTLWQLVKSEQIAAAKVGRAVRINRRSLDNYMRQHVGAVA
jgi:excisionase family DNA binding protein